MIAVYHGPDRREPPDAVKKIESCLETRCMSERAESGHVLPLDEQVLWWPAFVAAAVKVARNGQCHLWQK